MVKRSFLMLIALVLPFSIAGQMTADDLRLLAGESAREARTRANQVDANDLNKLLPSLTSQRKSNKPTSVKVKKKSREAPNRKKKSSRRNFSPVKDNNNEYVPPARSSQTRKQVITDAVPVGVIRYGISMGNWLRARLTRTATSADPGLVEIVLLEDVVGKVSKLPSGTLFFASKNFNAGTQRLDLQMEKAITPDGQEFELQGLIFDFEKKAGLAGAVSVNQPGSEVRDGISSGLVAAGKIAVQGYAVQDQLGGVVAKETAASIIDKTGNSGLATEYAPAVIHVAAQDLFIRVSASF